MHTRLPVCLNGFPSERRSDKPSPEKKSSSGASFVERLRQSLGVGACASSHPATITAAEAAAAKAKAEAARAASLLAARKQALLDAPAITPATPVEADGGSADIAAIAADAPRSDGESGAPPPMSWRDRMKAKLG
jgi:hypothetical protein